MNECFREPVISTQLGGARGGGSALTHFGNDLIEQYRAIEEAAHAAAAARLELLQHACRKTAKRSLVKTGRRLGSAP
jgi:molybdate transport system regulatory protein